MATVNLIFYSSGTASSIAQAFSAYNFLSNNGDAVTLKDVFGLSEATIQTYAGTLVAATYDSIYIFTPSTGAGTSEVTTVNKQDLRASLKVASQGTLGSGIENLTTHTTTSIGDSGETWVTNAYAGEHVQLYGGTGGTQIAYILSNNGTILTLGDTLTLDPDTSTDIKILTDMQMYHSYASTATAGAELQIGWDYFYGAASTNRPLPFIMHLMSDKYARSLGTSSAVAATTLTVAAPTWTIDAEIGNYVQIYAGTTFGHQYGLITDNSTTVLTLSGGWLNDTSKSTPTGTPNYAIINSLGEVFQNEYAAYFIITYLADLTDAVQLENWKRLVDMTNGDTLRPVGMPLVQDEDYLFGYVLPTGKSIWTYVNRII
jgi:hypothetical protein